MTSASSFEIVLFYALSTVRLSWLLSPRYESLQVPYGPAPLSLAWSHLPALFILHDKFKRPKRW